MKRQAWFYHLTSKERHSALSAGGATNQTLTTRTIASLQAAWKLLEERNLVQWIFKNLMWSQALCLAHSSLSLSPHWQVSYCKPIWYANVSKHLVARGENILLAIDLSLKLNWLLWIVFQFCEELYHSLSLFLMHQTNTYYRQTAPDAVWGAGDPKIKEGGQSPCSARFQWRCLLALFMGVFATHHMQLVKNKDELTLEWASD